MSVLAVFLFSLAVYVFNLKYWLQEIPGADRLTVIQGVLALSLFFLYLSTIWYQACPAYRVVFDQQVSRGGFVRSNIRLNIPILFPWFFLSLIYDLLTMSPWPALERFFNTTVGQICFFASFLLLLVVFLPLIVRYFWKCEPLEPSPKVRDLEEFLLKHGFRYRGLLRWPLLGGRMMTAGIMGIVPRYRYLLITDSLLEALTTEELEAVLAHEMGHARYRHLLFYVLFFLGFIMISFGLMDFFFILVVYLAGFPGASEGGNGLSPTLFYLLLSVPMLGILLVYFRYVMGFFMRHFERQADLYSANVMGKPGPAVRALEKIAYFSGKIRDLPSWHHFSVRERVDTLWRSLREPGLIRSHNRFVALCFGGYLLAMLAAGTVLNFGPLNEYMTYSVAERVIEDRLDAGAESLVLYQDLAMVYHHQQKYREAVQVYERIIEMDPDRAEALNNLAWILVTVSDEEIRDEHRGLTLAKRAVSLKESAVFLDTLAEAYYVNGFTQEAVEIIKEAITVAEENKKYYERQLKKFLTDGAG